MSMSAVCSDCIWNLIPRPQCTSIVHAFEHWGVPRDELVRRLALLLRVHDKSDKKLAELGVLVQQRDGTRCIGTALGTELTAYVDGLQLFLTLEDHDDDDDDDDDGDDDDGDDADLALSGSRAMGATSMLLALSANDLKRGIYGVSVTALFAAFFGRKFQKFMHGRPLVGIRPPPSFEIAADGEFPTCTFTMEHRATTALLFTVFSQLPSVRRQLSLRFARDVLSSLDARWVDDLDNYTAMRACCAVSGSDMQLPAWPALLAYLAQSRLTFDQHANWLSRDSPRPDTVAEEVRGYSYSVDASTGEIQQVRRSGQRAPVA